MSEVTKRIQQLIRNRKLPTPEECRAIREKAGLSQADLAEVLGTTGPAVSKWESGQRAPTGALRAMYVEAIAAMQLGVDHD